jgi:protein-S-isoprenylcysteine O-methyltransferase Ste14
VSAGELQFLRLLHPLLWLAWLAYWIIAARGIKRAVRREDALERLPYSLPLAFSVVLFMKPQILPALASPIWDRGWAGYGIGTAMLVAGLAFASWARASLGRNWSGVVTVKEDHELVQSGAYRLVRHPIYTGLLLALAGSAVAQDLWTSLIAVALCFVSFWVKLQREEAWMRETFGAKYDAYCAMTKRLVPLLW